MRVAVEMCVIKPAFRWHAVRRAGNVQVRNHVLLNISIFIQKGAFMKRVISALCCSVFAAVAAMPISMHAQTDSNQKTTAHSSKSSSSNSATNNSANKMQVSRRAVQALRLTQEARQALIKKDQSSAQTDVNKALTLVNQVEQKLPNNPKNKTHVVPIYAELEQTSFIEPALIAKNGGKSGGQQQQAANTEKPNPNPDKAENTSSNALPQSDQPMRNRPEVVKWVEGGFSYIALDLDAAREHLQAAQQALKNNNPGNADLELARAEGSVITGEIESNMPLVRARENLSLAQDDIKQGDYTQAKADLNASGKALSNYATNSQAPHAKEARDLSKQIGSAANSISQNHTGAKQKVEKWWSELADWTNQS
jgi:guanyl-specific ribonuclease Sa